MDNPNIMAMITLISSFIGILTGAAALYRSYKLTPREEVSQDAQAARDYAESAQLSNTARVELEKRLKAYDTRFANMENEQARLKADYENSMRIIRRQSTILIRWSHGITLLFNQLAENQLAPAWKPQADDLNYVNTNIKEEK